MITIKRKDCLAQYPLFPISDNEREEFFYPKTCKNYILTVTAKTLNGHVKQLGKNIAALARNTNATSLVFLGDYKRAWRYQENDYKHARAALQYLEDNGIGKRFNGGIEVSAIELPEFCKHLFWLQRCNAALPCFYFTNKAQNFVAHICRYGNLHIGILNKTAEGPISEMIQEAIFADMHGNRCVNAYAISSAIKGRQTIK